MWMCACMLFLSDFSVPSAYVGNRKWKPMNCMFSWSYRILYSFSSLFASLLFNLIFLSQSMIYLYYKSYYMKTNRSRFCGGIFFFRMGHDEDGKNELIVKWVLCGIWHHRANLCIRFKVITKNFTNFTDRSTENIFIESILLFAFYTIFY